ncbi:hypothetical protein OC845_003260 [Tilletia horrida]|nr:hypothetical protein OC845_003260 [Tilletia horrida]
MAAIIKLVKHASATSEQVSLSQTELLTPQLVEVRLTPCVVMAAPTFQLGRFQALQRLIQTGIQQPERAARSNEWYVGVTRLKADLATLASVPGPSDAERKEIESGEQELRLLHLKNAPAHCDAYVRRAGRITVGGATRTLDADFVRCVALVSKEINVSERYAAFLVQEAILQEARWDRPPVEVSCILFHLEQDGALACLQELLDGLLILRKSTHPLAPEAYKNVEGIVRDIMAQSASNGGPTLPKRLLQFVDTKRASIEQIEGTLRTGQLAFPEEFYGERIEWMQQNRKGAATALYLLASTLLLPADGILDALRWLQSFPAAGKDSIAVYILTTILAALDAVNEGDFLTKSSAQTSLAELFGDKNFVTTTHAEITQKAWKHPDLKNIVVLAWAQILALALPRSAALKSDLGAKNSDPPTLAQTAITGGDAPTALGAFAYLQSNILSFRLRELDVLEGEHQAGPDSDMYNGDIDRDDAALGDGVGQDFGVEVLERVKALSIATVEIFLPVLRKLQRAEEDAAFSTSRVNQRPGAEVVERRHDIQAFFDVIATVCRNRPDEGLQFCLNTEGRNSRFLNWALDMRDFGHEIGLFDMLISVSSGAKAAWFIHSNVLGATGFSTDGRLTSWSRLFDWIQHYIDSFSAQAATGGGSSNHLLPENEASLLKSFLALLRNVVTYSDAALASIYESQEYQALPRLFSLAQQRIPLPLRAVLFDALAAFARPSHALADVITSEIWSLLGSSQTVNPIGSRVQFAGAYSITEDIAQVEAVEHTYPATISFIRLLTALLRPDAPVNASANSSTQTTLRPLTVSDSLAKRAEVLRTQDITPYVGYVVGTVFLRHADRDFRHHTERWRLLATCLQFMHECLRTYSLEPLFKVDASGVEGAQNPQVIRQLVLHPGFEVMRLILADVNCGKEILAVLNPSPTPTFEVIDKHQAHTIFFAHSVRAAMKVLISVLRLHSAFAELLLPAATQLTVAMPDVLKRIGNVASYGNFDSQLRRHHESVLQIAILLLCKQQDVASLAARLLGLIADTDFFSTVDSVTLAASRRTANRLLGLVEVSGETSRVRAGAIQQLLRDPVDKDSRTARFDDDLALLLEPEQRTSTSERTQLSILRFVQDQIGDSRPFPNLAHSILGFDCQATNADEIFIPAASQGDPEYGLLHAIVDIFSDSDIESDSLLSPTAAERALAIIVELCRDQTIGEATLRFLRKRGNFFAIMLQKPSLLIPAGQDSFGQDGEVVWADGARIFCSETAVLSSLKIKTHLLDGFALEVHSLLANQTPHLAADFVHALFVNSGVELDASTSQRPLAQVSKTSLVALLDSLDFEWHDDRRVDAGELPLLEEYVDLFEKDARYSATLQSLLRIQQDLQKKGRFFDAKVRPEFEAEAALLLRAASGFEAQSKIKEAKQHCMMSWKRCLGVILASSKSTLRPEARGLVAFDILSAVLGRLNGGSVDLDPYTHELMSGATLDLLTAVRQHFEDAVQPLGSAGALGGIGSERLVASFKEVLLAMVQTSTVASARGNLYSAAVNFLHLLRSVASAGVEADTDADDTAMKQDQDSVGNMSTVLGTSSASNSTIASSFRSLLSTYADALIPIVAADALDEADGWKTVAFTFLAELAGAELAMGASRRSSTLDILARQGYLSNFISNLRQQDGDLQETLAPTPSILSPLYVYQALFALLTQLAHLRDGLARLVDVRIFDAISSLDVIDLRPSGEDIMDDEDNFFPAVLERYHDIVFPALQLCSVLSSRAARSFAAAGQGSDGSGQIASVLSSIYALLDAHQDTFTYALRAITQDSVTLSQLQLATLLVKLLTNVLPVVGRDLHSKAFLPYHSAINILLSVYLCEGSGPVSWRHKIVPSTAAEQQAAQDLAPASTTVSQFDADVELSVGRLNGALLAYSAAATSLDARSFNPMFSSSLSRPDASNGVAFLPRATNASVAKGLSMKHSSMATLGTLIASLEEHAIKLEDYATESDKILTLMESHSAWVFETCAEILGIDLTEAESISIAVLRRKAFERLRAHQKFVRALVILKLDAVEILLILLLRHFAFYLDFLPRKDTSKTSATTPSTGLDRLSIRTEGATAVNEIIERLSMLTLPGSILPGTESRHALIQMTARRLQAITVKEDE